MAWPGPRPGDDRGPGVKCFVITKAPWQSSWVRHARSFGGSLECQAKSCLVLDRVANKLQPWACSRLGWFGEVALPCGRRRVFGVEPDGGRRHDARPSRNASSFLGVESIGLVPGTLKQPCMRPRGGAGRLSGQSPPPPVLSCGPLPWSSRTLTRGPQGQRASSHQEVASPGRGRRDQRDARLPPLFRFPFWLQNSSLGPQEWARDVAAL
jgi:hypothetical protein